jgi:ribosomal protein S18 acetylase RimI-like enzyme
VIEVRPAKPADAPAIGAAHVSSWRSTYAGVLPDAYLAKLSLARQAHFYDRSIRMGNFVLVAVADGRVVGFCSARATRPNNLGDGEVETLYVLDDYKDLGIGRKLLRGAASHLAAQGCTSVYAWVLQANPATFFYERVGGKRAATSLTSVGGTAIPQTAYTWKPIARLLEDSYQKPAQ